MNLQEDLTRNRRVFELLTEPAATADSAELRSPRETRSVPMRERAESARKLRLAGESRQVPAQSFSLAYGSKPVTGMSLSFEAPQIPTYPELAKPASGLPPDPLDSLYRQLEVEARMSSQLSVEEDY